MFYLQLQDNFDIATTQTVLPLKTEKVAESNETNMPSNRPIRNRKPRKDLDMVYNDPKRPKRRLSSQSVASGVSGRSVKLLVLLLLNIRTTEMAKHWFI